MSLRSLLLTDLRVAIGSKVLWLLFVLFAIVASGRAWTLADRIATRQEGGPVERRGEIYAVDTVNYADAMVWPVIFLVSLLAIVVAHRAIAGDRDSGSMKLLLALPHSRLDVLAGKFLARSLVVLGPVVGALLLAAVVSIARHDSFSALAYAQFLLVTAGIALCFVSVALAVSTATDDSTEATAGAFGIYVLLGVGWQFIVDMVRSFRNLIVEGRFTAHLGREAEPPDWFGLLDVAGPAGAYHRLVTEWIWSPTEPDPLILVDRGWQYGVEVAAVSLLLWIIVPLALATLQFRRVDL